MGSDQSKLFVEQLQGMGFQVDSQVMQGRNQCQVYKVIFRLISANALIASGEWKGFPLIHHVGLLFQGLVAKVIPSSSPVQVDDTVVNQLVNYPQPDFAVGYKL
jgi:hypothetical protein